MLKSFDIYQIISVYTEPWYSPEYYSPLSCDRIYSSYISSNDPNSLILLIWLHIVLYQKI